MVTGENEVRIHATLMGSRSNGPGKRNVVWFQGCTRCWPGCFNPETHNHDAGQVVSIASLADILLNGTPDGVSISGGEPLEQPDALLNLLKELRRLAPKQSLLLFTGFSLDEVHALPNGDAILACLDVLVAGPYIESLPLGNSLLSSQNQTLHLLSSRHKLGEFKSLPQTEAIVRTDGTIVLTGVAPLHFIKARSLDCG